MRFQSTKNVIKRVFILPLTRSFSINGLRLTNAKTSFAAGFGYFMLQNYIKMAKLQLL